MNGEYKTPGGKLVRVDFEIEGGRLNQVVVSGDFFLYPDDSLEAIRASLEGASATSTVEELTALISLAMPSGTEWLGSSPEALATAVKRALSEVGVDA